MWEFSGSSVVRTPQFYLGQGRRWGVCLIPGRGTKVLQAAQCNQKGGGGSRGKEERIDWETWKEGGK